MPRIRTLKPEFWTDEKLAGETPLTRLVFLGLISLSDDAGRLVDGVKTLDGQLFPETDDSCRDALERLAELGRIRRYVTPSGQRLLQVVNWRRHQRIEHPSKYVLPPPPDDPPPDTPESLASDSGNSHASTLDLGPATPDRGPPTGDRLPPNWEHIPGMEGAGRKGTKSQGKGPRQPLKEESAAPFVTPFPSDKLHDTGAVLDWLKRNASQLGIDPNDYRTLVGTLAVAERAMDRATDGKGSAAGTFVSLMKTQATDQAGVVFGIPTDDQRERGKRRLMEWHAKHRDPFMAGILQNGGVDW